MTKPTVGKYRWTIVALLLFSTTINYMDRNVIGYLKDYFCAQQPNGFGWSAKDFSYLTAIFTGFYAGFTLFAGFIIDKVGTKLGLAASLIVWSLAGIASAFMGIGLWAHNVARAIFGAGEAGNFPASIKTVAEWFPKKERALATGIFNSGSNIGAMICALIIPVILAAWNPSEGNNLFFGVFHGWQMAFIITGLVGFLWLIFWSKFYGTPKQMLDKGTLTQTEYDYIHSGDEPVVDTTVVKEKVPWYKMLTYKQTWAFVLGKFMTDGIWWFLLFWLPTYIKQQFCVGMSLADTKHTVMISTFIVYGIAIVGSIYGGSIPMTFMNKGWQTYKARMTALLLIAFAPLLLLGTQYAAGYGIVAAIAIISIGGASHQAWSANLFTTVSDMFPKSAVGSVTGIGAAAGGLGGVLVQLLAGGLEDKYRIQGVMQASQAGLIKATDAIPLEQVKMDNLKNVLVDPSMLDQARHFISSNVSVAYGIMFTVCALAYLTAWGMMKALVPKHKPITDL
ncbi:MFS transporter [Ferruginibacter lapsinanis]|uniref:MFS transporter n=1 Tax=Ferruginibacter lapsinanis TaxID=563172 RepID=UPI001E2AC218|nr:MFS transporter [Ferruginibacter lapsinanis]UEG49382.1 MFS transporter [Ferruginibacter lapsinanis]